MASDTLQSIIDFIYSFGFGEKPSMSSQTRIEEDLGITGDDAVELLISFGKKFNVNMSNFMAADYFEAEGVDILGPIIRLITRRKKPVKKVLTIGHLEKAILAGRLDEEVINS